MMMSKRNRFSSYTHLYSRHHLCNAIFRLRSTLIHLEHAVIPHSEVVYSNGKHHSVIELLIDATLSFLLVGNMDRHLVTVTNI